MTTIDNTPITGVLTSNAPEWLNDDLYNAVDLDFNQYIEDNPDDPDGCGYYESDATLLIGFVLVDKKGYEPDPNAEYSAIVGPLYTQVVMSKYTSKCALCSPCYPGQGDLDTPGDLTSYTLPPEVWGNSEHLEIMEV